METIKAVNSDNSRPKIDRGTSLSLKQYNLIFNFLKNGDKPAPRVLFEAELAGNLNSGQVPPKTSCYTRFRSIAQRLRITRDNQLVFKTNNKIVLPRSRFKDAIMEAHQNDGIKHLNITRTIEKLSEKYTMGCRQFGISEDIVRVVVKKCHFGSCGLKKPIVKHSIEDKKAKGAKAASEAIPESSNFTPQPTNQGQPSISASYNNLHIGLHSPMDKIPFPIQPVQMIPLANGGFALRPLPFLLGTNIVMPLSMLRQNMWSPRLSHEQPLDLSKVGISPPESESNKISGSVYLESRMPNLAKMLAMPKKCPFLQQFSPQGSVDPVPNSACPLAPNTTLIDETSANGGGSGNPSLPAGPSPVCNSYVDINNNISVLIDNNVTVNTQPASVAGHGEAMETGTRPRCNIAEMYNAIDNGTEEDIPVDAQLHKTLKDVYDKHLPDTSKEDNTSKHFDEIIDYIHEMRNDVLRCSSGSMAATSRLRIRMGALEQMLKRQQQQCAQYLDDE